MNVEENKSNWAKVLAGRERDIDTMLQSDKQRGRVNRIIRGKRCTTEKELFQEFAAALQFPYYFGENWDAFDECISDLNWLDAERCSIAITNCDQLLAESTYCDVFFKLLKDAHEFIESSNPKSVTLSKLAGLQFILHVETENKQKFLDVYGDQLREISIENLQPFDKIA